MHRDTLERVLAYVDQHIYEKISLPELADVAGYSPFYFSKLFAEAMGIPVTGYIRIRKLQYALCSLLEGKKVLEVSLMYAFESHEGFTRSFSKVFGMSPSTVRKYLTSYQVPKYRVPDLNTGGKSMEVNKEETLLNHMHLLVFEVLRTSLEEAEGGYCTEIQITLFSDGSIKIADNGRGIPLSNNVAVDKKVLEKIFAGHPITNLEYAQMGDFAGCNLQTVNSLSESLRVNVFRNGNVFRQDYVRGIPQHDIVCAGTEHESGTEIIFRPDRQIFGDAEFSAEVIKGWIEEHVDAYNGPKIIIKTN
ncbi:MAG: helix-turn-helix domain-containing protein [Lachnospiraceae bacterium]|nr:helix-turn-helix domain-containing protein [Lachnospiraceae bacterium]